MHLTNMFAWEGDRPEEFASDNNCLAFSDEKCCNVVLESVRIQVFTLRINILGSSES